jgi:GT2 family glycosyltransferase
MPIGTEVMESRPAVAVLLAVHDRADSVALGEALGSVANQTYPDVRLFVYADGPLPPALESVIDGALRPGRDRLFRGQEPRGLPHGLNVLIGHALGDPTIGFFARMDADDLCVPERLEAQIAYLQANPGLGVCGSWCIEFAQDGHAAFHKRLPTDDADLRSFALLRSPFVHPTVVFRRAVLAEGYRYDEQLLQAQDYDLWVRLILAGVGIGNVPAYLLWYRVSEDFFRRRAGWVRARDELRMRWRFAKGMRRLDSRLAAKLLALFLLRLAPTGIKRLAYDRLR